ncbi:MBL fold metallo-hydrolase [Clostridium oceanicum]|uniref:MBL fold metallo-hydrolase n=1 Tax=Clostridium oceanicum TaxID=1543 RepID=A0ABP3V3K4_9CLOT
MDIRVLPVGIYGANCYIVMDSKTKKSGIIDPGGDGDEILHEIKKMKTKPQCILLTHGHMDHTGAADELRKKFNIPIYISAADEKLIQKNEEIFGKLGKSNKADIYLNDKDIIKIGDLDVKCINTPGHTPGGVSFYTRGILFTGDTLFKGSIGRTDLAGGNFESIIESIKNKIMVLADSIKVLPGHGPATTIEYERNNNPFI